MKEKIRYDNFDIMRGVAMMVIIWWHTINTHSPLTDGWVMPSFFLVMGVFYRQLSFNNMIKKKAKTILIPYIVFSIPAFFLSLIHNGISNTLKILINPYRCINGFAWFLVCIFFCYVIYWSLNKIFENNSRLRIISSFVIAFVVFYLSQCHIMGHRIVLPFFLSTSLECLAFIETGCLLKLWLLSWSNASFADNYKMILTMLIVTFLYCFDVFILYPNPMDMIWSDYDVPFYRLVIDGIIGTVFILIVCTLFKKLLYPIRWIGQYSLLILLLHGYILTLVHLIEMNDCITYSLTVVLSTVLSLFIDKYIPAITGK